MNKLFIFKKVGMAAFLLMSGLLIGCTKSPETKAIAANQSNENDRKLMNISVGGSKAGDEPPVNTSKIPTVTYCDLTKNAAVYDKKVVRVRAIYFSGFEQIYLYDDRCESNQPPNAPERVPAETWAEWDKAFVSKGDSDEAKLNRQLNGFGRKDVTVVGIFHSTNEQGDADAPNLFGHMNCCRYQFSITRVEKIVELENKKVKTQIPYGRNVKFALRQKIDFEDFTLEALAELNPSAQTPRKYLFSATRGDQSVMIYSKKEAKDNTSVRFEFGGESYLLETGVSDISARLGKDELIVQKVN